MTSLIYLYTLFVRFNTLGADRDHKARVGAFEGEGASRLLFWHFLDLVAGEGGLFLITCCAYGCLVVEWLS